MTRRIVAAFRGAGGQVFLADSGKGTAFRDLQGQPGVRRAVAKTDIAAMVDEVVVELLDRFARWQDDPALTFEPLLLVLEEAFVLLSADSGRDEAAKADQALTARLRDAVAKVALMGREAKCFLCCAPQRGDASLFNLATRDQLGMRVLLLRNCKESTAELALELPRSALVPGREPPCRIRDLQPLPGRVLVEANGQVQLAQVSL